jgi:hypothetical protein
VYRVIENSKGSKHLGHMSMDGRIVLQWMLEKWFVTMWIGCSRYRVERIDGVCIYADEPVSSVREGRNLLTR